MEVRYQVFVSSTYEDLKEERKEISQAILECDCIPAGMELFPASSNEQWDVIKRVIDESDIFLVVVAGKYGSIKKEEYIDANGKIKKKEISYTEMEFNYAKQQKKPIIALIRRPIDDLPSRMTDSGKKERLLNAFRNSVCDGRMVKFWHTEGELKLSAFLALSKLKEELSKDGNNIGWVRANQVEKKDDSTIIRLNTQITECLQTIQSDKKIMQKNDAEIVTMKTEIKELSNELQAYKNALDELQNRYYSSNQAIEFDDTISSNQFRMVFWKRFADYCDKNEFVLFSSDSVWKDKIQKDFDRVDIAVSMYNKMKIWSKITLLAKKSAVIFSTLSNTEKHQYLSNAVVLWESFEPNRDALAVSDKNFILLFSSLFSLFYISEIENLDVQTKHVVTAKLFAALEQCVDFSERLDEIEDCLRENDAF